MKPTSFRIWTDGASRGNPGPAAIGVVIYNGSGEQVFSESKFIGRCTNNVAEYVAVLFGLLEAVSQQAKAVHLFLDSELVARQLTGVY